MVLIHALRHVPDGSCHRPVPAGLLCRRQSGSTQQEVVGQVDTDVELDVEVVDGDGASTAGVRLVESVGTYPTTDDRRPEASSCDLDEVEEIEENGTGPTTTDVTRDAVC